MAVRWLTPFRWLHNRLHAEKRHYPHVTVDNTSGPFTGDPDYPEGQTVGSYTSPSVHYLGQSYHENTSL